MAADYLPLDLTILPDKLSVCRLPMGSDLPRWALSGTSGSLPATTPSGGRGERSRLTSVVWTNSETSVVCATELAPAAADADHGWRALAVVGPLDLDLTGVIFSIARPLAEAGVAIFAISTYETDYVLVKQSALDDALAALRACGHRVR